MTIKQRTSKSPPPPSPYYERGRSLFAPYPMGGGQITKKGTDTMPCGIEILHNERDTLTAAQIYKRAGRRNTSPRESEMSNLIARTRATKPANCYHCGANSPNIVADELRSGGEADGWKCLLCGRIRYHTALEVIA